MWLDMEKPEIPIIHLGHIVALQWHHFLIWIVFSIVIRLFQNDFINRPEYLNFEHLELDFSIIWKPIDTATDRESIEYRQTEEKKRWNDFYFTFAFRFFIHKNSKFKFYAFALTLHLFLSVDKTLFEILENWK